MSPAVSATAGRTTHFHVVANGDFGVAGWDVEPDALGNFRHAFIHVERNHVASSSAVSSSVVFVFYEVIQCDASFNCTDIAAGAGSVPAGRPEG